MALPKVVVKYPVKSHLGRSPVPRILYSIQSALHTVGYDITLCNVQICN